MELAAGLDHFGQNTPTAPFMGTELQLTLTIQLATR